MKTAIVTGAGGFVGLAVVKELSAQGVEVFAVVRKGSKRLDELSALAHVNPVFCDMNDYAHLEEHMNGATADSFYHFAWEGSAGSKRGDESCQLNNVRCACEAVRAAKRLGCSRFIFAGSIMEYEVEALMRTDAAPALSTMYSTAKKTADYLCRALSCELELPYVCALISNIYGPGETSPRLINTSIRKLLRGEETAFSSGEQLYDFIYVDDAARAFALLGSRGRANRVYYLGSEEPRPLRDFLTILRDTLAPGRELGLGKLSSSGVSLTYREFDRGALAADTGFAPAVSFREGVRRTAEWIRKEEQHERSVG